VNRALKLSELPTERRFKWRAIDLLNLFIYLNCLWLLIFFMSNKSLDLFEHRMIVLFATIGIWRYSWWFINFVRALIYEFIVFKRLRKKANTLLETGWKPPHVYFVIACYKEDRETLEDLLTAMIRECLHIGVPATLFLSGDYDSEIIVRDFVRKHIRPSTNNQRPLFQVVAIRQTLPDKRIALGQCLRSLSRYGVVDDCPVVLMDSDAIMSRGVLRRCMPFFQLNPKLHALTTDERAIFNGPKWMAEMTELRFAQRHLMMQSHSLSKRVLTLTGRLSMFRSQIITTPEFIDRLENDYIDHWLWGRFRFLSGDDKSTWFLLLKQQAEMLYVRDVMVYTVEHIEGNGLSRTLQNLLRWSGNMLRNNGRAIDLGPGVVPPFIWWCLFDQRLVIWTSLVSPIAAILMTIHTGWAFIPVYLAWLGISRLGLSLIIFRYAGRIHIAFPFLIYILQITNALIKVYILFRLPRQKWANRTGAKTNLSTDKSFWFEHAMAKYLTVLSLSSLVLVLAVYTGVMKLPF
jgi:glycosyltransferase Alg8